MPAIRDRSEDNAKRRNRLAKIKRGPGHFVYDGSCVDVSWEPTPLLTGHKQEVFDGAGRLVLDSSGRQVYAPAGKPVRDDAGRIVMGGEPRVVRKAIEVYTLRGVSLPKGEPVYVAESDIALKLRGMDGFQEVEPVELVEGEDPAPKKRGRPRKSAEAVEPEAVEG